MKNENSRIAFSPLSDWALSPHITHLSHGSYGALPKSVETEMMKWHKEMEEHPDSWFCFEGRKLMAQVRQKVADTWCAEPGCLVLVSSAMAGMNTVLNSLSWEEGDEIVYTNHIYRLLENALLRLADRKKVRLIRVHVPLSPNGPASFSECLKPNLSSKTRLLVLDQITSPTAILVPLKEILAHCKSLEIPVMIDGAHGPGHTDFSLKDLGTDFFVGNLHKWVSAPRGSAFLHAAPKWHEILDPATVTTVGGSLEEKFLYTGTRPAAGNLAIPKALDEAELRMKNGVGDFCKNLLQEFRSAFFQVFPEADALVQTQSEGHDTFVHLLSLALPTSIAQPNEHEMRLREYFYRHFQIEVPFTSVPCENSLFVRPSAASYNNSNDFDRLLWALKKAKEAKVF
jgi:isopenicillin-N epimerase